MNLYRKLFGLNLMRPEGGDDVSAGGGAVDRGDSFAGTGTPDQNTDKAVEDDLKVATGKTGEEVEGEDDDEEGKQPRGADGKFTKKEKDGADATIPKSRFDDAVRKERERAEAAERRLAEIEKAQRQVARGADISKMEADVKELRAQERKALIAGEDDKAAELADQADRLNRQIAIEQSRDMSVAAKEQAREEIRWELTVERIEAEYPELDEKSDSFDQDLTDDVLDKMNGIMKRDGVTRSQALLKATQYIMSLRKPADAKTESRGLDRGAATQGRKEAAVAKNIDAANRQPAATRKVGADSDKFGKQAVEDINSLTMEEFAALPESTKAKMRGDII